MHERFILCHLIARTLAADGVFMKTERDFLRRAMDRWQLTDSEREEITTFEGSETALACVGSLPLEARQRILEELADAVLADGHISPHELRTLREIREAMGFPQDLDATSQPNAMTFSKDRFFSDVTKTPEAN